MHFFSRRTALFSACLVAGLLLAACGTATANTPAATNTPVPTNTPAPTNTVAPTATATPSSASGFVVQTANATVAGKSETILTDAKGMTLYYFTPDSSRMVACTGGCAATWPPLKASGPGTPTAATALPGRLAVVSGGNGAQVEYNGHPLYTFAGDTAAGQTNGQGLFGKWFVVTPNVAQNG